MTAVQGFDPSRPNIARVYDYWLGGKDNFAADRELAQKMCEINPAVPTMVRDNRAGNHRRLADGFWDSEYVRTWWDFLGSDDLRAASSTRSRQASNSPYMSPTSTTAPAAGSPSGATASTAPLTRVMTTGTPQARASAMATDCPS